MSGPTQPERDPANEQPSPSPPSDGASSEPVVEWEPTPEGPPVAATPPVLKLWRPGDVGVISFLFGFPAGLGLAARNWFRLGQRRKGYAHLAMGAVAMLVIVLLPSISVGVAAGINVGVAVYLYQRIKADLNGPAIAGHVVERAGVASGIATMVGGWLLILAPAIVVAFALSLAPGASGGIAAGTVAFGTSGSECQVSGVGTSFSADQPLHAVVAFSREVKAGEVVHETVTEATRGQVGSSDISVTSAADCYYGDFPANALPPGSYTLEYNVGSERLAQGQVTITAPGSS